MRGQGLSGLRARLNDQIEILGEITCQVKKFDNEIGNILVVADVRYRGSFYPETLLVVIEFLGDKSDDLLITDKYPLIYDIKEIRKFRELLMDVLLKKVKDGDDLQHVVRTGIGRFIEDLKKFDEFKAKKARLKASIDRLIDGNPDHQKMMNELYSVLGLIPGNERILVKK